MVVGPQDSSQKDLAFGGQFLVLFLIVESQFEELEGGKLKGEEKGLEEGVDTSHGTLGLQEELECVVVGLEIDAETTGTWEVATLEEKLYLITSRRF